VTVSLLTIEGQNIPFKTYASAGERITLTVECIVTRIEAEMIDCTSFGRTHNDYQPGHTTATVLAYSAVETLATPAVNP
jgi:hypothetical protein